MNLRDPSKTDTEKIHKIEFEEQNEVPFKFRKVQEDVLITTGSSNCRDCP